MPQAVLLLVFGFLGFVIFWGWNKKNYWKTQNVPHVESPIFLGHFWRAFFMRENVTKQLQWIYNHPNARNEPFVGINIFHKPAIFIRDPDLVKRIMVKDFNEFSARHTKGDANNDPIGARNLFQVDPPLWAQYRKRLTPVFTSGKMKQWFSLVEAIGSRLNKKISQLVMEDKVTEVRQQVGFYTLDTISLVALATDTNALTAKEPTDFFKLISTTNNETWFRKISINFLFFLSDLIKYFGIKSNSASYENGIRNLFYDVYNQRLASKHTRGDLIDALIAVKKTDEHEQEKLFEGDDLVAQANIFLFAGFETSSNATSVSLHALAFFPIPQKFDPSRFDPEVTSFNEYAYLPFGAGPRNCIGDRFGKMQVQVALANILKSFKVEATPQTPKILQLSKESVLARADGGIYLRFTPDELFPLTGGI